MSRSGFEQNLIWQCRIAKLPAVTPEFRFHPVRRWKVDLAFVPQQIAVEVEGAVFKGGRHTRGVGVEADCEKYAELAILGWRLLRVTPRQVKSGVALGWIERALAASGASESALSVVGVQP